MRKTSTVLCLFTTLFILALAGSGQTIPPTFYGSKVDFASGTQTRYVILADIDGDGKLDILSANDVSSTVSIFRNSGLTGTVTSASFDARIDITAGTNTYIVNASDIDGDGKLDIIVANRNSNTISIFRNTSTPGNISLDAKVDFATGSNPQSIAVGDINGDGLPDVVTGNLSGNSVSVFQNTSSSGMISMAPRVDFVTGSSPQNVILGDVNADGKPEILVTNYGANSIGVFQNVSAGGAITSASFNARVDFSTGASTLPNSVSLADVNADGKPDIVVTERLTNAVGVLRNNVSGSINSSSFAAPVNFTVGTQPYQTVISDVDRDGKPDIIAVNSSSNKISVLRNNFSGTFNTSSFNTKVDFSTGSQPLSLAIGDINGDGLPELVTANFNAGTVSVLQQVSSIATIGGNQAICTGGVATLTFTAAGSGLATITYTDSQGGVFTATGNANGSAFTVTTSALPAGTHTFTILSVTDANGNGIGSGSATVAVNNCTASALNFDGANDYVEIPNSSSLNSYTTTGAVTIEYWIKPSVLAGTIDFMAHRNTANNAGFVFEYYQPDNIVYHTFNFSGTWYSVAFNYTANIWQHVAIVVNGNTIQGYLNGVLKATTNTSGSLNTSTDVWRLGMNTQTGGRNFTGTMDEVRIWNRALCQSEIQHNMNCELDPTSQTGLVALYHFNEGIIGANNSAVTTLTDASGNANDGTLNNFALNGATSNWVAPGGVTSGVSCTPFTICATAVISGNQTICSGGSATLTFQAIGSGLATITYTDSQGGVYTATGNADASPFTVTTASLSAGTHTFTIIALQDANGSTPRSVSITVISFVTPIPIVTAGGTTTVCSGGNVTLTSSSATGNQWYKDGSPIAGATSQTYNVTASGNYSVAVSQNGCPAATSTVTTVTFYPPVAVPIIATSGPTAFCSGGSVTLTSTLGATYQWYKDGNPIGGATSQTYNVTVGGDYMVATSQNNCPAATSTTTTVTVYPPVIAPIVAVSGPTTFCSGGSVTLTSSPGSTYQWFKDGNPIAGAASQTYNVLVGGNYMVATSQNGCPAATSTITAVTVFPPTPIPMITAGGTTTFCFGGSVVLTSSSSTNNQWLKDGNPISGATGQTYTATVTGSYIVSTSLNGCPAATSAATTVTVYPPTSVPTVTPNGATTFCLGGSLTLTSSSATGNQWFKDGNIIAGATSQTFNVTTSGNYLVAVSQNGCPLASSGVTAVTVNAPAPVPTITPGGPIVLCNGGNITLSSSSSTGNQWYKDGSPIAGATNQLYNATISGDYRVSVFYNVCPAAVSNVTTVTVNSFTISASVTQNPVSCSSGSTTITVTPASGIGTVNYSLVTPGGVTILQQGTGNNSVSFSNIGAGLYTITATNGNAQMCSASTSVTVSTTSAMVFNSMTVVNNTCFNGMSGQIGVSATGTSIITYTLTKPGGGQTTLSTTSGATVTFTGLAAGYYNISASDANNCPITTVASVVQPILMQAPLNNNGSPDVLLTSAINPPTATFTPGSTVTITYTVSSKNNSNIAAQGVILRISKPFSGYQITVASGGQWTVIADNSLFTEIQLNAGLQIPCSGSMSVSIAIKRNGFDSQSSGLPVTAVIRMPGSAQDLSDFDNSRSSLFRVQ